MSPRHIVDSICRHYLTDQREDVNPLVWKKVDGCLRSRNLAGLASCSLHFDRQKHTIKEWRFLRQVEAFYKKNADLSNGHECKRAALESFLASEVKCSETNVRLRKYVDSLSPVGDDLDMYIRKMKLYVSRVLGDYHLFLESLPALLKVTSGATAHTKRAYSLPQLKLRLKLFATRSSFKYLDSIYRLHGFENLRLRPTFTNRVELVPKNWKTHRTIACEPEGNLPLQLAFDGYAKRRLRRVGINLRDQSANQKLAVHGSIHGDLATVDFQAASDTISYNTVALILPADWFGFLRDVRTPGYRGSLGRGVYSKFSSMGNGSTFAIETLIFAAACYAVGSKRFSVYGDDVIIETELYSEFERLTRFLGFTINREKTFTDGSFRESCGVDCYDGIDVTPVYIRGIDSRKALMCHLVNTLWSLTFPGSALGGYLEELTSSFDLPYVPFMENTLAGVWIDPLEARSRGILRSEGDVDYITHAYVAKAATRKFHDIRGYYLWFLAKGNQTSFPIPWVSVKQAPDLRSDPPETSSVPVFQHKYVRKEVGWRQPSQADRKSVV